VIAQCGNEVTEAPAEECDDGGLADGDGCDASCLSETALESSEGLCITAINDQASRVAKAQGKENLSCLAAAAGGSESDANACLSADEKGKVARAHEKTVEADQRFCSPPPAFGYAGGDVAASAAQTERRSSLADLLGQDLSAAVLVKGMDGAGAACQRAIAKAADRLQTSFVASFSRCVKDRIGDGMIFAGENLEDCFEGVSADALVASSHVAMDLARLWQVRIKSCSGVDLSAAFPGRCAPSTDAAFDECIAAAAKCRMCLSFNRADALAYDCDLFDNGSPDASCIE